MKLTAKPAVGTKVVAACSHLVDYVGATTVGTVVEHGQVGGELVVQFGKRLARCGYKQLASV